MSFLATRLWKGRGKDIHRVLFLFQFAFVAFNSLTVRVVLVFPRRFSPSPYFLFISSRSPLAFASFIVPSTNRLHLAKEPFMSFTPFPSSLFLSLSLPPVDPFFTHAKHAGRIYVVDQLWSFRFSQPPPPPHHTPPHQVEADDEFRAFFFCWLVGGDGRKFFLRFFFLGRLSCWIALLPATSSILFSAKKEWGANSLEVSKCTCVCVCGLLEKKSLNR